MHPRWDASALGRSDMSRKAQVSELGCGIFLTAAELRVIGVDPNDVDAVEYVVTESGLVVGDSLGGNE